MVDNFRFATAGYDTRIRMYFSSYCLSGQNSVKEATGSSETKTLRHFGKKIKKVQSPTERPFHLRARLVTMSVANEGDEVKGESSWILVEHASSKHLEVIQS